MKECCTGHSEGTLLHAMQDLQCWRRASNVCKWWSHQNGKVPTSLLLSQFPTSLLSHLIPFMLTGFPYWHTLAIPNYSHYHTPPLEAVPQANSEAPPKLGSCMCPANEPPPNKDLPLRRLAHTRPTWHIFVCLFVVCVCVCVCLCVCMRVFFFRMRTTIVYLIICLVANSQKKSQKIVPSKLNLLSGQFVNVQPRTYLALMTCNV